MNTMKTNVFAATAVLVCVALGTMLASAAAIENVQVNTSGAPTNYVVSYTFNGTGEWYYVEAVLSGDNGASYPFTFEETGKPDKAPERNMPLLATRNLGSTVNAYLCHSGSYSFAFSVGRPIHVPNAVMRIVGTRIEAATRPPTSHTDNYCIVDISGGPTASNYPVTFTSAAPVPTGEFKTTKIVLRRIPAGSFVMGSPTNELGRNGNETQHTVTLTRGFYMGVHEITQAQYSNVIGSNPSAYPGAMRPVEQVSWNTVRGGTWPLGLPAGDTFMDRLWTKTGLAFDLPTEAQWEYACRAGTAGAWNNGTNITNTNKDGNLDVLGRYYYNGGDASQHADVGSYLPNAWGLYDMHGNVWEWCLDWYADYATGESTEPVGAFDGSSRVFRGGSWAALAGNCRSADRNNYGPPGVTDYRLGFRPALPAGQ